MLTAALPPTSSDRLLLNNRVEILTSQPMQAFASPGTIAFGARMRNTAKTDMLALLATAHLPIRHDIISSLTTIENMALCKLVDTGTIDWTEGVRYPVLVYAMPIGSRLFNSMDDVQQPLDEDVILKQVLAPFVSVLRDLNAAGIMHGAIRPTNITMAEGASNMQLGDGAAMPCGYGQPTIFETLERAMARSAGRGPGQHSDDLFALGVTALMLAIGRNPVAGQDEESVLFQRMDRGSYHVLAAPHRFSGMFTEMFKGLLQDHPKQRWTASDLDLWLSGKRPPTKPPEAHRRATRPINFDGRDYQETRTIAHALTRNVGAAQTLIESGEMVRWLKRTFSEERLANEVGNAVDAAMNSGKTNNFADYLAAKTAIALDPRAPLRFRGAHIFPSGYGAYLAEQVQTGGNLQVAAELISANLCSYWLNCQSDRADALSYTQSFESCRVHLERPGPGYGLERVLYELNPQLPCQSPLIKSYSATTAAEALKALEDVAKRPDRPTAPLDRHLAAFLICRERRLGEALFLALAGPENTIKYNITLLTVLANAQYRQGPPSLPNLAGWIATLLDGAIDRHFSRPLREQMRTELEELVKKGVITDMVSLVDNASTIDRDRTDFLYTRKVYAITQRQINKLQAEVDDREGVAARVGRPIAAGVSVLLGLVLGMTGAIMVL